MSRSEDSAAKRYSRRSAIAAVGALAGAAGFAASRPSVGYASGLKGTGAGSEVVDVRFQGPSRVSRYSTGFTNADTSLFYPYGTNDQAAVENVEELIDRGLRLINTHIMAWGVNDPWLDPSDPGPSNWDLLDQKLELATRSTATPVITLCEAPWWMKGQLNADGTTTQLTEADDWQNIAYGSRILDNKMDAWLALVTAIAERYMVPPFNVRHFQVWNELKGYYNSAKSDWDISTSPGDPTGPNAEHGYTYMYNRVYTALKHTANRLGIPANAVSVGGPYVVMDTWGNPAPGIGGELTKSYGTFDNRDLNVIRYWLKHKVGAEFIAVDANNGNKDGVQLADVFTASEKFADTTRWIRSLDNRQYPGAQTLPVWFAEWYATPYTSSDPAYNNAVKAYSVAKFIEAGGTTTLEWTGGPNSLGVPGLWTPTNAGGGQPTQWYQSCAAINDYFGPGTELFQAETSSNNVAAIASSRKALLINKTDSPMTVRIGRTVADLAPYDVRLLDHWS